MSKKIIVGFNGAPQSWKSTTAQDTRGLLWPAGIGTRSISFVGFMEDGLTHVINELDVAFNEGLMSLDYEQAKATKILDTTGRELIITAAEGMKGLIPDLPAKYAAAMINRYARVQPDVRVFFLENVGFPNEYRIMEELGIEIIRVYMTDKRALFADKLPSYEFGDTFLGDSRKCLLTPDSLIDPTPQDLARYITDRLEA